MVSLKIEASCTWLEELTCKEFDSRKYSIKCIHKTFLPFFFRFFRKNAYSKHYIQVSRQAYIWIPLNHQNIHGLRNRKNLITGLNYVTLNHFQFNKRTGFWNTWNWRHPTFYRRMSCKNNVRNITTLLTAYKVGNNLMFPSKGANSMLV